MLVDLTRPLTCEDVAEIVGVDKQTVMRWARQGELDGVKIGKRWYFSPAKLAARLPIDVDLPTFDESAGRPRQEGGVDWSE